MNLNNSEAPASAGERFDSTPSICADTTPTVKVRIARTISEVEEIRQVWCSWNKDRDTDIDLCLKFVWASHEFVRPHVIVIYREEIPDAMLVGRLERTKIISNLGYWRISNANARVLTFASNGFLGNLSSENFDVFIDSIRDALRQGDADAALLQQVNLESPLYQRAVSLSGFAVRDHLLRPTAHHLMRLGEGVDQMYRGLSQGLRAEIRRKKKKLLGEFGDSVSMQCLREPAEVEAVFPRLEEIAKKTYQRALGVGFRDDELTRQRLLFFAERRWLRIYLLSVGSRPWAFWIGTLYEGNFSSGDVGFEPQHSQYSPGTFLLISVIEDLCNAQVKQIDFGSGEAEYKERFGNLSWNETNIYVFAPTIKGARLNAARTVVGLFDDAVRKGLGRTKLLARIKKLWRSRLAGKAR